ncbi:MAG: hypothetical protein HKM24_03745 [Gammaproteobacteria bacterium]|nr:hypothetical protein [Gammaproteobacteria bacterium]
MRCNHINSSVMPDRQTGVALIINLVLLFIMTLMTITTMDMSIIEMTMVETDQSDAFAFEGAEALAKLEARRSDLMPLATPGMLADIPEHQDVDLLNGAGEVYSTGSSHTRYQGLSIARGFELSGDASMSAFHFEVNSQNESGRSGDSEVTMGVYVVGPSGT